MMNHLKCKSLSDHIETGNQIISHGLKIMCAIVQISAENDPNKDNICTFCMQYAKIEMGV
jgi:hypothetical protein